MLISSLPPKDRIRITTAATMITDATMTPRTSRVVGSMGSVTLIGDARTDGRSPLERRPSDRPIVLDCYCSKTAVIIARTAP